MANILPQQKKSEIKKEYQLRLLVVGLAFVSASAVVTLGFLIPSHILLQSKIKTTNSQISAVKGVFEKENGAQYSQEIRETREKITAIEHYKEKRNMENTITAITEKRNAAVYISRISFEAEDGVVKVSGTAGTREALLSFNNRLKNDSNFETVELPVSNLAENADVPFSITISLAE